MTLIIRMLLILSALVGLGASADTLNDFENSDNQTYDKVDFFKTENELVTPDYDELDLNKTQTAIARQTEKENSRFSILSNQLFKSDKIRIFNFTAFDQNELKDRLGLGNLDLSDLSNIQITFGYGIEYQYQPGKAIGYEYLSAFPYDRGQLVRIFWNQKF